MGTNNCFSKMMADVFPNWHCVNMPRLKTWTLFQSRTSIAFTFMEVVTPIWNKLHWIRRTWSVAWPATDIHFMKRSWYPHHSQTIHTGSGKYLTTHSSEEMGYMWWYRALSRKSEQWATRGLWSTCKSQITKIKTVILSIYLVFSEPGVCDSQVYCAALFLKFCVALDKRLQRLKGGGSIKHGSTVTNTHKDLLRGIITTDVIKYWDAAGTGPP